MVVRGKRDSDVAQECVASPSARASEVLCCQLDYQKDPEQAMAH